MEGRINFFECDDKSGKRPHYKGYVTIGEEVHEFAVWPAKSGKGYSGSYKPKQQKQTETPMLAENHQHPPLDDDEIVF